MPGDPIVRVIQRYHPEWEPPRDNGRQWIPCRCPWHGDDQPSASVSFRHNSFKCHACPVKGDVIKLIRLQEGVGYATAVEIAAVISAGSDTQVSAVPPRIAGRRVFGEPGVEDSLSRSAGGDRPVQHRLRRRSFGGA